MIAIYSNTGEWGGVDVLIARFADYLRSRHVPFFIVEPAGSRLRLELPWASFVDLGEISSIQDQVTHVFVPSVAKLQDKKFPWIALAHARLFTWVVHPNDVFLVFYPFSGFSMKLLGYRMVGLLRAAFRPHAALLDALFFKLVEQQALAVMDGATSRSLSYFVPSIPSAPPIIPIPSHATVYPAHHKGDAEELSIGYLGRMDSMKWSAMKPFIRNILAPMAVRRKITLHVVSEGSHLERLKQACQNAGIRFIGYGYLPNDKARETIIASTDIAVAMGTSALDIAGCGHPCVVLDPGLGVFSRPQTSFRFIHESSDYTLGEYRDFPGYIKGLRVFEDMVGDETLESAAAVGKSYVELSHNPEGCFKALLLAVQSSNLLVSELMPRIKDLADSFAHTKSSPLLSILVSGKRQARG